MHARQPSILASWEFVCSSQCWIDASGACNNPCCEISLGGETWPCMGMWQLRIFPATLCQTPGTSDDETSDVTRMIFLQLKTATRGETGLVETKWHKMNRRSMRLKRIGFNWAGTRRHCQSRTSPWIERHTCDRGQLWPNIHLRGPWNSTCCKAAPRGPWNLRRWNCCFSLFFPQPCVHLWGFYGSS